MNIDKYIRYNIPTAFAFKAIIMTCIQHYFLNYIGVFTAFSCYQESIKSLLLCIIGGLVSLLGLAVAGISFLLSLSQGANQEQNSSLSKAMILYHVFAALNVFGIVSLIFIYMAVGGQSISYIPKLYINLSLIPIFIVNYILFLSVSLISVLISIYKLNGQKKLS